MKKYTISFAALIFITLNLAGCSSSNKTPIKAEVTSYNNNYGLVKLDGGGWGREGFATYEAHKYCLKLSNGYGVDSISSLGSGMYSFSCVIKSAQEASAAPSEKINQSSGSKDSKNQCREFGFVENRAEFSNCVLQLELAKKNSAENEERYRAEQAEYERQLAAIEREKERRRGAAFLELGARMMGGQRPIDALGSLGTGAPIAPARPAPINQTITLPNGRMINCTTMGTVTNCF